MRVERFACRRQARVEPQGLLELSSRIGRASLLKQHQPEVRPASGIFRIVLEQNRQLTGGAIELPLTSQGRGQIGPGVAVHRIQLERLLVLTDSTIEPVREGE